jgi:hypothetical protein
MAARRECMIPPEVKGYRKSKLKSKSGTRAKAEAVTRRLSII